MVETSWEGFKLAQVRGDVKKNSLFRDIVQIEVDPLPPTLILTNLFLTKC